MINLFDIGQISDNMYTDIQHKNGFWILIIVILPILLISSACNNSRISKLNEKEIQYVGKIKISAGDDIDYIEDDTLNYLTYPMNVALYKGAKGIERKVMVIGKSIKKEQNVGFKPFALLRYETAKSDTNTIVMARPLDDKLVTAEINNYFEFISIFYGAQQLIETWIKNEKGFGSVRSMLWYNEEEAIKYLEM